ncbi:MAG: OsmC family protein [Firmicutes bacterium]|nr:OsmC family protein [Bacillota bacterium]
MTTAVTVRWLGSTRFVGLPSSGPPIPINFLPEDPLPPRETYAGPAPAGPEGPAPGPKPTELLLIAAGACTGLDIVSLLEKQRVEFTGLEIEVRGERATDWPRVFTDIEVVYRLAAAPAALPHLERAARLSMEKYCSVSLSLSARKSFRCEVVPDRGGPSS